MTIRNLDYLFAPKSVALIGASKEPSSIGAVLARNLLRGSFDGPVMPVNPYFRAVERVLTYPDVARLPITPDLAIISAPPETIPPVVAELAGRGTRAAVVIGTALGDSAEQRHAELRQAMLDAARPHLMRILGPNCLGVMVPGIGLNGSFAHLDPLPGQLAFVAQSGAVVTSVIDWATARGIGFSHLVSLGDMADIDFGDMLDYLANDPGTRAILLYIEAVTHARKFMSAGRAAARMKPVIVVKAGRHPADGHGAAPRIGAMAAADAVYDTAFRRAGMLRVLRLEDLFDAVQTLATAQPPRGDRLAIVTNSGGTGLMAADSLLDEGGRLAELAPETMTRLDQVLPRTWSRGNPIHILADAPAARYTAAVEALLHDRNVHGILVINCPSAVASSTAAAQAVAELVADRRQPMVVTSWLGDAAAVEPRRIFAHHRVPTYATPDDAVNAFMQLVSYRRNQEMLMETPASLSEELAPDLRAARAVVERALQEGRTWLTDPEGKEVLAAYDVSVAPTQLARDPHEAASLAADMGAAVVLKIVSPDIVHKTDIGGVALDLSGPGHVREAAEAMLARVRQARPEAQIRGISVQPMVRRPNASELVVGVMTDPEFGPMVLFGQGGTAVDVVNDAALALPPLNMHLAHEVMSRTRIFRLLEGYPGRAPANLDEIAFTLIKISQLVIDVPEIEELDVNPLLADEDGVVALDVRIKVAPARAPGTHRLAIRPYPRELEETIQLGDGRDLILRPVLPEDEPAFQATFAKLTPEEIRLRFFTPIKTLSHVMAARFTQLDYDREMALVLAEPGIPGRSEIYGVASLTSDPDNERAEYAILVRHEMTGLGLGILLMRRIIEYARSRGIGEVFGDVLRENTTMLKVCDFLGFERHNAPDDPGIVRVVLKLREDRARQQSAAG